MVLPPGYLHFLNDFDRFCCTRTFKKQVKLMAWLRIFVLVLFSATIIDAYEDDEKLKETAAQAAKDRGIDPENLNPGQVYMTPPVMTEEEENSQQMPKVYRCDGCRAISYQFAKAFSLAEKRFKKGSRLPYSDVLEVTENVCDKMLANYGVKSVDGQKFLSGEGLKYDKTGGIMQSGGRWEVRLKIICAQMIEEHEEEEIYNQYVQRGGKSLARGLCTSYCGQEKIKKGKKEL